MSAPTVILSAPIDWGKSRHADALRREFGCATVVDDWQPNQGVTPGALHLTDIHPGDLIDWGVDPKLIVRQGWPAQPCMQHGHICLHLLLAGVALLGVGLIVTLFAAVLGGSHYLDDHWHVKDLFGTNDVATAQPAANTPRTLAEAVQLACGPKATGKPVGPRDIQCFDLAGRATFYAVGGQP